MVFAVDRLPMLTALRAGNGVAIAPAVFGFLHREQLHLPLFKQATGIEERIAGVERAQAALARLPVAQSLQRRFQVRLVADQHAAELEPCAALLYQVGVWCQCLQRRGAEQPGDRMCGSGDATAIARQQILQQYIGLWIFKPG